MSDTPQTDAIGINHVTATDREYKLRNLARELERENAALRKDKDRLDWLLKDDVMRFGFVYHDRDSIDAGRKAEQP